LTMSLASGEGDQLCADTDATLTWASIGVTLPLVSCLE
jgi:hypothetical protein